MLSESEYNLILDRWMEGIASEISFWNVYMGSRGATGSHKWEEVIADDRPFRLEEDLELPETCFLDAGSGPFSRCGVKTDKTKLTFVAVDALAPAYTRLKQMHGISTGTAVLFGFTEILSDIFPAGHFDIVHMSNSLDHCIDPVLGLFNLFHVCKVNGKVILRHAKNEAVTEKYDGLHQWNLCVEGGKFFVWRGDLRIDVQELFGGSAVIHTTEDVYEFPEQKWKYDKVVIRKLAPMDIPHNSFRKVCFEKLAAAVYGSAFETMQNENLAQRCAHYEKELSVCKQRLAQFARRYEELSGAKNRENAKPPLTAVAPEPQQTPAASSAGDAAVRHRRFYEELKRLHPTLPLVDGIELTNTCNLSCPNCPTPTTKYPRGFASEHTVMMTLRYAPPGGMFSFHRLGEPFLHKDFLKYLRLAATMGFQTVVSTNGILLDQERIEALLDCRPASVMVSLHTRKSLEAFARLAGHCFSKNVFPGKLCANLLSHNREQVFAWTRELGVDARIQALYRDVQSHSWAGNVAARKTVYDDAHKREMVRRCFFIRNSHVNVRWDGTVVACCLDSENVTQLGHVRQLPAIRQRESGYELCRTCDEDWMHS